MINSLKKHVLYIYLFRRTKNVIRYAVILAHYYQDPEIQDATNFMGDNLDLDPQTIIAHADVIHQLKKENLEKTLSLFQQLMTVHVMNALICD